MPIGEAGHVESLHAVLDVGLELGDQRLHARLHRCRGRSSACVPSGADTLSAAASAAQTRRSRHGGTLPARRPDLPAPRPSSGMMRSSLMAFLPGWSGGVHSLVTGLAARGDPAEAVIEKCGSRSGGHGRP